MRVPVSVVILTKNEERFIARAIESARWADEVLVVDSGSTDRTREIARGAAANVQELPWLGWTRQRNTAMSLARNEWIMMLDADEIVTPELARAVIAAMASDPDPRDGYVVDRRDEFCGRLVPNMKRPRKRREFIRLFNRRFSQYDPELLIHEEVRSPGKPIPLAGILLHWRGTSLHDQFAGYVRNAVIEAEAIDARGIRVGPARLIVRPMLRFLWCYVARGGMRMGTRGLVHAMISASAEFMRHAMAWERQNVRHSIDPPASISPAAARHVEPLAPHAVADGPTANGAP